jgi:hypothetical protein
MWREPVIKREALSAGLAHLDIEPDHLVVHEDRTFSPAGGRPFDEAISQLNLLEFWPHGLPRTGTAPVWRLDQS